MYNYTVKNPKTDLNKFLFQRPNRTKSASTKQLSSNEVGDYLDTIKIQIQGSHSDLSDNQLTLKQNVTDGKHIHFQDSPEFYHDDDERTIPEFNVVVEPPSPQVTDELRTQRINDLRRHSSHSPSLSPREYDKDKDRRHSGINPNLLGLDSEHMKFLNCSPAASRRISCGSLFKVRSGVFIQELEIIFFFLFIFRQMSSLEIQDRHCLVDQPWHLILIEMTRMIRIRKMTILSRRSFQLLIRLSDFLHGLVIIRNLSEKL